MAIPRNLVYIFILAIVGAFAGMGYVVYFDIDINSLVPQFAFSKVNVEVHPLYKHLQKTLPRPPENVTEISMSVFQSTKFSHFVNQGTPVVVNDAAAHWDVVQKLAEPKNHFLEDNLHNDLNVGILRKHENGTFFASNFHKNSQMSYKEFSKMF